MRSSSPSSPSARVAQDLERAVLARSGRREGEEIRFRCPYPGSHQHGDEHPSARYHRSKHVWCCDVCKNHGGWRNLCELLDVEYRRPSKIIATYAYTDEAGHRLFEVVRKVPKAFLQRRPNGSGGWIWHLKGVRRVLYRLPEVVAAVRDGRVVYLVEGEKDADSLSNLGLVATTNPGGAGNWRREYTETLRDARVVLLGDNDTSGQRHLQKVAQILHSVAAEVRVVELPELPSSGDVSDWIDRMHRQGAGDEEIRASLAELVARAKIWSPADHQGSARSETPSAPDQRTAAMTAHEALRSLWALGKDPTPSDVQRALVEVAANLEECSPLELQTAREMAIGALKGQVNAPAKFVDAALAGVSVGPRPSGPRDPGRGVHPPYLETEDGLVHLKPTKDGETAVPLTNFTATIVGEVELDDGVETRRRFEVKAHHRGRDHRFEIGSEEFPAMQWVGRHLGATAIVNAGMGTKDHARAAIQYLSDRVESRTIYTHLGWRLIGEEWSYLHSRGAIGPVGPVPGVETQLPPQLDGFCLPELPVNNPHEAVRASLSLLGVGTDKLSFPIYSAIWRSVLGGTDFALHLAGQTGEGKTELAALAQQHFGSRLDARHLPGSWSSTGNALEALAFSAKDALLVVDDFAPEGSSSDVQRLHREASRLLRAQGNRAGRNRLRPDGSLRPVKAPRGLILSTGEDIPRAHSIRARLLILEITQGGMDWEELSRCQEHAAGGQFAQAMAAFLQWLAREYAAVQERRAARVAELRSKAQRSSSAHRRTPWIVAELAFGLETFLTFASETGATHREEARNLWRQGWEALGQAAAAQAEHLGAAEPTTRFLELLGSALASGRAHVAGADGDVPEHPGLWGWRNEAPGAGWHAQGDRIGWVRGDDLYLDPDAAYRSAEQVATVDGLSVVPRTLWKRLRERDLLASVDRTRTRNTVRVTLQGARRKVIHLRVSTLLPSVETAQSSQEDGDSPKDGPFLWADSGPDPQKPAQRTGPGTPVPEAVGREPGPVGPVGPVSDPMDESWDEV